MPVSETDRARVIEMLLQDVEATLGPAHRSVVVQCAATVARFADDPIWFRDKLSEEVQQYFHDGFVDTVWPSCPRHPGHPLWLRGEHWFCERP